MKRLKQSVSSEYNTTFIHLKMPNDYELIEDFDHLSQLARQYDKEFSKHISPRIKESQKIIDAIWNNINPADHISKTNAIASVIDSIHANPDISMSPCVSDKMAMHLSCIYPQNLPTMSGRTAYERLFKRHPSEIINVLNHFVVAVNNIKCSSEQAQYCVDVLAAVLEDGDDLLKKKMLKNNELSESIQQAIEKVAEMSDDIVPIAIHYPEFASVKIFNKTLSIYQQREDSARPEAIFEYCKKIIELKPDLRQSPLDGIITCFIEVVKLYTDKFTWRDNNDNILQYSKRCSDFLNALQKVIVYDYKSDSKRIHRNYSHAILQRISSLFKVTDDANKIKIVDLLIVIESYGVQNSTHELSGKINWICASGSESCLCDFIHQHKGFIKERCREQIRSMADRFEKVCHLLLETYPDKRGSIISANWPARSEWLKKWIENNASQIDKEQKQVIQSSLLSVANSNNFPLNIYETLGFLKIGNNKGAVEARIKHFDKLLSCNNLTSNEGLQFVLERIDLSIYKPTEEQNANLKKGWNTIDQGTASVELKQLVRKIIKI